MPYYRIILNDAGMKLLEMEPNEIVPDSHKIYLDPTNYNCPLIVIWCIDTDICEGDSVTIYSDVIEPRDGMTYKWYVNDIFNGVEIEKMTYVPSDGDKVYCELSGSWTGSTCSAVKSNDIIFTVNKKVIPEVSISYTNVSNISEGNYICEGDRVLFSANVINGGSSPTYQWYTKKTGSWEKITGEVNPTLKYVPVAPEECIGCYIVSNYNCLVNSGATGSTCVTVEAKKNFNIVLSANPSGATCSGTSVTYSVVGNEWSGSTPIYRWYVNSTLIQSGTSSSYSAFTYKPSNSDTISVIMTSSYRCVNKRVQYDTIYAYVNQINQVQVDITSVPVWHEESGHYVCSILSGEVVLFSVEDPQGTCGGDWSIQWYLNNNPVGSGNYTYVLNPANEQDEVYCKLFSDCPCTTGNPATSKVIEIDFRTGATEKKVYAYSDKNEVCSGSTVCFTGVTSGFSSPTYQWKDDGNNINGANSLHFCSNSFSSYSTFSRLHNITLEVTEGSVYVSNSVPLRVYPNVTAVVNLVQIPSNNICEGSLVIIQAYGTFFGNNPYFIWYKWVYNEVWYWENVKEGYGTSNNHYSSNSLVSGDRIKCEINPNHPCSNEMSYDEISIENVYENRVPDITLSANTSCVSVNSAITFTAYAVNGGTSPTYKWGLEYPITNVLSTNSSFIYTPTQAISITMYCEMTSNYICVTNSTVVNSIFIDVCKWHFLSGDLFITAQAVAGGNDTFYVPVYCITPPIDGNNLWIGDVDVGWTVGSLTSSPYIEYKKIGDEYNISISALHCNGEFSTYTGTYNNTGITYSSYMFFINEPQNEFRYHIKLNKITSDPEHPIMTLFDFYTALAFGQGSSYYKWAELFYINVASDGSWWWSHNNYYSGSIARDYWPPYPRLISSDSDYVINSSAYFKDISVAGRDTRYWKIDMSELNYLMVPNNTSEEIEIIFYEVGYFNLRLYMPNYNPNYSWRCCLVKLHVFVSI